VQVNRQCLAPAAVLQDKHSLFGLMVTDCRRAFYWTSDRLPSGLTTRFNQPLKGYEGLNLHWGGGGGGGCRLV